MVTFTRTLQKHVAETGIHYVLAIPREIAHVLDMQDGGLCSIESRPMDGGKAEAVLDNYLKRPMLINYFDPSKAEAIKIPIKDPVTKGPSQSIFSQELKLRMASLRIMSKFLKAMLPSRRRRRRKPWWR